MAAPAPYTAAEQQELLTIAREALAAASAGHDPARDAPVHARLLECAGAFVTLYRRGELRGCVGTFETTQPVYQTVRSMAVAAGVRDSRFPSVEPAEVDEIVISISVLTPPTPIERLDEIVVGRDGLVISHGYCRGVLLGKVAVERQWSREEFLAATCTKAGLRRDAWHTFGEPGGITIERFEAFDFGEQH